MQELKLTLYVAGRNQRVERIVAAVHAMLSGCSADPIQLSIVDVLESPHIADEHAILVTPALVRHSPAPVLRIVGDVTDPEHVLPALGLRLQTAGTR